MLGYCLVTATVTASALMCMSNVDRKACRASSFSKEGGTLERCELDMKPEVGASLVGISTVAGSSRHRTVEAAAIDGISLLVGCQRAT